MSIPIFLSPDNNYALPAYITLYSLLINYRSSARLDVFLLVPSDFSERNEKLFKTLENQSALLSISIINMKDSFADVPINTSWITTATMYRLHIPHLAQSYSIDKCIYLDSDIIVEGDISELFDTDIDGYCVAAVKERAISCDRDAELRGLLGVPSLSNYINAGVLLLNIKEIEKQGLSGKLEEMGRESRFPHNDQDAINSVFYDQIKILPVRFNAISQYLYDQEEDSITQYGLSNLLDARKRPLIIHYIGKFKPWACNGTILASRWWKYVRMQDRSIQTDLIRPFIRSSKLSAKERVYEAVKTATKRLRIYKAAKLIYQHTIKRLIGKS